MTLPTVDVPTYDLILPSNGREVTIRPFLVKEEKLLLMAAESNDTDDIIRTTKQVIRNCMLDKSIDIDALPFFDIDYLFIALRAKSIGESVEMQFTCNNIVEDDKSCGHIFEADIDISNVEIEQDESIPKVYQLDGNISVKMKYPSYSVMKDIQSRDNIMEKKVYVIVNCIEQIIKGESVYSTKDYTKDELKEFVENLTEGQFKKLELFVDNFPTFYVHAEKKCPKCGYTHNIRYKDFQSFFH